MASSPLAERVAGLHPGAIDVHAHAIDPDLPAIGGGAFPTVERVDDDRARIQMDGRLHREIDSRCWSPAARIRDMDAEGVGAQVLSAIPVTLCHGEPAEGATALAAAQNDFLAGLVDEAPDRLLALGCVPLQDTEAAVAELIRCVDVLGLVGVEIGTRVGDRELTDDSLRPFFQAAAGLGAVVFVHPVDRTLDPRLAALGIGFGMGMPTETATAAAGLLTSGVLDELPGLRLCLAHAGGTLPWALPRLAKGQQMTGATQRPVTEAVKNLWCDSLTYDADALLLAVERFGRDHVVLGTDYPFAAREEPAGAVLADERLGCTNDIARTNATALLNIGG